MNSEQENELITYLISVGFNGEQLRGDIREYARKSPASFTVKDTRMFDQDRMVFQLLFERDHQFKTYRLKEYKATIQYPVNIEHHLIGNIDTSVLEEKMKAVDWEKFFKPGENYPDAEAREIQKMVSDLWQLTADGSSAGVLIQDQLQFKYWPEEKWDDSARQFAQDYQRSRVFSAGPFSITNANLSFYHTSGLIDDIHESLSVLMLEEFPGVDVYGKLEEILSKDPDQFNFKCHRNTPEGYIEYDVPVKKVDGWFSLDTYTATLTPYPSIAHGVYNGIDTKELEAAMSKINWRNDADLFILHEDKEPDFMPPVGEIQAQIFALSQDMAGAQIADQLQLKYWVDATFFDSVIGQSAWDHLEELPKISKEFGVEVDAKRAFNLLCGRPVLMMNPQHMFDAKADQWVQLDLSARLFDGNYATHTSTGLTLEQLEDVLRTFLIPNQSFYQVRNSIIRGDLVPVTLTNDKRIFLAAAPEEKGVHIFSEDGRPIQTNIHLDPDWTPKQPGLVSQAAIERQQKVHRFSAQKPFKRNKGRGL